MLVGLVATLDAQRFIWAACFAGSALLAWLLLRRWREGPGIRRVAWQLPTFFAWRGRSADDVATLCEGRIGLKVDAAAPATLRTQQPVTCALALAGEGVWVLEDESRVHHPRIGRVLACWDRSSLVANVEHPRRGERLEFSWPRQGALVRGRMPRGSQANGFLGCLLADELDLRG
jgi:hypothetical protein